MYHSLHHPHSIPGAESADPADGDGDRRTPRQQAASQEVVHQGRRNPNPEPLLPPETRPRLCLPPAPDPLHAAAETGRLRPLTSSSLSSDSMNKAISSRSGA